jgi:hypothetical protein
VRNNSILLLLACLAVAGPASALCAPPEPPLLPETQDDMCLYADLLRSDFEAYIAEAQVYFRCLSAERTRVFAEAQEVTAEYRRFLNALD